MRRSSVPTRVSQRRGRGPRRWGRPPRGVPAAGAVAVAMGQPLRRALVEAGADLGGDLGVHHGLGEDAEGLAQKVQVGLLGVLAEPVQNVHCVRGHGVLLCVLHGLASHEDDAVAVFWLHPTYTTYGDSTVVKDLLP